MRFNRSTTEIRVKLLANIENDGETTVKLTKVRPVGIIVHPVLAVDRANGSGALAYAIVGISVFLPLLSVRDTLGFFADVSRE